MGQSRVFWIVHSLVSAASMLARKLAMVFAKGILDFREEVILL